MSYGLAGQRVLDAVQVGALAIAQQVNHLVGTTVTKLTRPSGVNGAGLLVLMADSGGWRVRLGDYVARTVTYANATEIVTSVAHGFTTGDGPYRLTNSGGGVPTGLSTGTDYWIIKIDADTFYLATSLALAQVGTKVSFTTDGSGTNKIADNMPTVETPVGSLTSGHGAIYIPEGQSLVMPAAEEVTVKGFDAADVLTYYWVGA